MSTPPPNSKKCTTYQNGLPSRIAMHVVMFEAGPLVNLVLGTNFSHFLKKA
jgi:hypothetical protein